MGIPLRFIIVPLLLLLFISIFIFVFRNKRIVKFIPSAILVIAELYLLSIPRDPSWGDIVAAAYSIPIIILLICSLVMALIIKPDKEEYEEENKICPNCKIEYRKEFEKCSDCGALLEIKSKDQISKGK